MKVDEKTQLAEALAKVLAYHGKTSLRDWWDKYHTPAERLLKRVAPEIWKRVETEAKASECFEEEGNE